MKKEILMLSFQSGNYKRYQFREQCIKFWSRFDRSIDLKVFNDKQLNLNYDFETVLRTTKDHVSGYNEIYEYLYSSDLDYALIIDDDVILHDKTRGDFFKNFESIFSSCDVLSPMTSEEPYLKNLVDYKIVNKYKFIARINLVKNFKKHLDKEILCKSNFLRHSDTEFGINLMQNGIRHKKDMSVIEKTFCYNLSTIGFKQDDKSVYQEELKQLVKKYSLPIITKKDKIQINYKRIEKQLKQNKLNL